MPIPDEFLHKFNIDREKADATGLSWEELQDIKTDFANRKETYEQVAATFSNVLRRVPAVHAISARVKDPEHLVAKIVRKRIEQPDRIIDKINYRSQLTDLVGVRALHLFKADWEPIDAFVRGKWDLHEKPVANIRKGDDDKIYANFEGYPETVREHPAGYRSVHYIAQTMPEKELITVEVQVRTIYEEAWSEIDHKTRYPYRVDDHILGAYLSILNKLSGASDEMGTFIQQLMQAFEEAERRYEKLQEEAEQRQRELKEERDSIVNLFVSMQDKLAEDRALSELQKAEFEQQKLSLEKQIADLQRNASASVPTSYPLPRPLATTDSEEAQARREQITLAAIVALGSLANITSNVFSTTLTGGENEVEKLSAPPLPAYIEKKRKRSTSNE